MVKKNSYIYLGTGWCYNLKYKLYNQVEVAPLVHHILCGRGISYDDVDAWLNAGEEQINSWRNLGETTMNDAVHLVADIISENKNIMVIVDSDADGFTSAVIFINYLYKIAPNYAKNHIDYYLHSGKQHGLQDYTEEVETVYDLIVCPDSSSNDYEQHQHWINKGSKILILDHHEAPHISPIEGVITINNQLCDYSNKDFSGAGIAWQWCRAYDEICGYSFAKDLIDLCALGNLSDMMDYRSLETKAIVSLGLQNIHNPFFYYMVEKNKFSINKMGGVNYMSMAFYVTPFINAIVRSGTMEEKELIFKSMLQMYAFEKMPSGKRGHKGEEVPLVEEAVRICANVKARQTKLQDATMALLESRIHCESLLDNSIIIFTCEPGQVEKNLAGLVANKIQAKYQRPCLVLTKSKTKDDKEYFYRGSARNYGKSEIEDLRQLCEETNLIEYATGHANAFGFSIAESNLQEFIDLTNQKYANVSQESIYWVDYIWSLSEVDPDTILQIAEMRELWGQEIPESRIALHRISLSSCQVQLLSADKNPTIKISLPCGVDVMKFKSSQEEYEQMIKPNAIISLVGTCNKNEWNGRITAQILVEDFELTEEWVF